jgi:hypothetical protein
MTSLEDDKRTAQWLLDFVRSDAGLWRREHAEAHQKRWAALMGSLWERKHPPAVSTLVKWHDELQRIVERLEKGEGWAVDCHLWRQIRMEGGKPLVDDATTSPRKEHHADADTTKFLIKAMDVFYAIWDDMRLCGRSDCGKLFVRTKRQEYCSETCRGTVGKRRYRRKPALK